MLASFLPALTRRVSAAPLLRALNPKGELFASTFTFGLTAVIKLCSSLVLTRMLSPETYGIFAILLSFLFMVELMSDVGSAGLLIRSARGNEVRFVHTIWTIRLIRCGGNFCLLFLCAPLIARLYTLPALTDALRMLSLMFLLSGAESMSFVLAVRDRRARISNYAELFSNIVMTVFVILLASILKNHYALIYGTLLQRALLTLSSYFFYRDVGVGFALDRGALREQFQFARFVMPSSILTILLSQYDKLVLLKLFNVVLLGVYSIASNMAAPITGLIVHNARAVLYARCAEYFRTDRATARTRYYAENAKLLTIGVLLPAVVAGFAQLLVAILYDVRYVLAGHVLMVLALGAIVAAFQNASENILVASGRTHTVLVGNAVRLLSLVPASFVGYYTFGFDGFLWFNLAAAFAPLGYFYYDQQKLGLLSISRELKRFATAVAVFLTCLALSHLLLAVIPAEWLHLHMRKH